MQGWTTSRGLWHDMALQGLSDDPALYREHRPAHPGRAACDVGGADRRLRNGFDPPVDTGTSRLGIEAVSGCLLGPEP